MLNRSEQVGVELLSVKMKTHLSFTEKNQDFIRAPTRGGRDWKIRPRRPGFAESWEISRGKSQGSREILRDFPLPWVLHPEGRGVRNPWPREILRAEGMDFPFFHHYQVSIDFNIVNIHPTEEMYFFVSSGNRDDIE